MLKLSAIALVMQLGATASVDVTLQAEPGFQGAADLTVDASALTQDKDKDVSFIFAPARVTFANGSAQTKLTVKTKTSAPSFTGGKFTVVARSGSAEERSEATLDVQALYTVNVLQKKEGKCADNRNVEDRVSWVCDFDSPAGETAYFRKHAGGLQVVFHNATTDSFYVHGSGNLSSHDPIEHMSFDHGPLQPGKDYKPVVIKGGAEDPSNLKASYTLHDIYRPSRDMVFNAETIPAARPR